MDETADLALAAESHGIFGRVALASNDMPAAVEHLSKQLTLVEMMEGTQSVTVATILEDLGWARIREAELLTGLAALEVVASPQVTGNRVAAVSSETGADMMGKARTSETGAEMLQRAHRIRSLQQGIAHETMVTCCIRLAEWYWVIDDYDEVVASYDQALLALRTNDQELSKEAVLVRAWQGVAHSLALRYSAAASCFDCALRMVGRTHGKRSWEKVRLLADRACLLQTLCRNLDSLAPQSQEAIWVGTAGLKARMRFRRLHHQLHASGAEDDESPHLATFAPLRRSQLVRSADLLRPFAEGSIAAVPMAKQDRRGDLDQRRESEDAASAPTLSTPTPPASPLEQSDADALSDEGSCASEDARVSDGCEYASDADVKLHISACHNPSSESEGNASVQAAVGESVKGTQHHVGADEGAQGTAGLGGSTDQPARSMGDADLAEAARERHIRQLQQQRSQLQLERLLEQQRCPIPKPKRRKPPKPLSLLRPARLTLSDEGPSTLSDGELAWQLALEDARRSPRRGKMTWRLGFDDGFDTTRASNWTSSRSSSAGAQPRRKPHEAVEVELCCNLWEHEGGCAECALPAGHPGEHDISAGLRRRRRADDMPPPRPLPLPVEPTQSGPASLEECLSTSGRQNPSASFTQRCCNVWEHKGGCSDCTLPAGHPGPHEIVGLGRRR